jgi:hypothetical protein
MAGRRSRRYLVDDPAGPEIDQPDGVRRDMCEPARARAAERSDEERDETS